MLGRLIHSITSDSAVAITAEFLFVLNALIDSESEGPAMRENGRMNHYFTVYEEER